MIEVDELPGSQDASIFHGHEHGAQASFFLSHNRPGTGPKLHRHPYEETFIVHRQVSIHPVSHMETEWLE